MTSKLLTKKSGLMWCLFKVYTGVLFLLSLDCNTHNHFMKFGFRSKSPVYSGIMGTVVFAIK